MRSVKILAFFLTASTLFASCNRDSTTTAPTGNPIVWGKLSAIKQYNIVISGLDTVKRDSEIAAAEFISDPSTPHIFVDAGAVTINDIALDKDNTHQYTKVAAPEQMLSSLGLNNGIVWHATGQGLIPPLSFKDTAAFPIYNPALPYDISKSNGLELVFDSTTVTGSDSVRVLIDDAKGNVVQKTFYAKAGQVNLPPTLLSALSLVSDQTAVIAIMPYIGTVKPVRNKGFHIIRERRIYQSVNISN